MILTWNNYPERNYNICPAVHDSILFFQKIFSE